MSQSTSIIIFLSFLVALAVQAQADNAATFSIESVQVTDAPQVFLTGTFSGNKMETQSNSPAAGQIYVKVTYSVTVPNTELSYDRKADFMLSGAVGYAMSWGDGSWFPGNSFEYKKGASRRTMLYLIPSNAVQKATIRFLGKEYPIEPFLKPAPKSINLDVPATAADKISAVTTSAPPPKMETWTSLEGKTIKAELLRLDGETLILKRDDGNVFRLPAARLSQESQLSAKQQGESIALSQKSDPDAWKHDFEAFRKGLESEALRLFTFSWETDVDVEWKGTFQTADVVRLSAEDKQNLVRPYHVRFDFPSITTPTTRVVLRFMCEAADFEKWKDVTEGSTVVFTAKRCKTATVIGSETTLFFDAAKLKAVIPIDVKRP